MTAPIRRPSDVWPAPLLEEYRRLSRLPGMPIHLAISETDGENHFVCRPATASPIFKYCTCGQDYAGVVPCVRWLAEGPKIVDVTEDQYQALSRVEVRLEMADFAMPYPTLLVNMPPGKMHDYVLLHRREVETPAGPLPILIAASCSASHLNDIVTVVRQRPGHDVDESLGKYTDEVTAEEATTNTQSLRVACNMALAMTNFGCQASYLFPGEAAEQRRHAARGNRRYKDGTRASDRLAEQPMAVVLERDVELWHREGPRPAPSGEPTGREMPFHWRRGHWRKARVGAGRSQTKLTLIRPCMVRADLLVVGPEETTTTYTERGR